MFKQILETVLNNHEIQKDEEKKNEVSDTTLICMEKHMLPLNNENILDGIQSIYYINMETSQERKNHIESLFQDKSFQHIPKCRISAINGKDANFKVENYIEFYNGSCKNARMLSTEYATTISHINAIYKFVMDADENNWDDNAIALIVEDDLSTEFMPYWRTSIRKMIQTRCPKDWEIVQLSYILFDFTPYQEYESWEMRKNLCGTAAYIIKLSGARRFINYLTQYSNPAHFKYYIDGKHPYYHHADRFLYSFFNTYSINPPLFTYRDNNDSVIHPDHIHHHVKSKERTKKLWLGWDATEGASL